MSEGVLMLLYAIQHGESANVQSHIDTGVDVNAKINCVYPLIYAIETTSFARERESSLIVKALISAGADVNIKNYKIYTPLMTACTNRYLHIARVLINNGADVNAKDESGFTPLLHLISAIANNSISNLITGLSKRNYDIVVFLLNSGADILTYSKNGKTVISYISDEQFKIDHHHHNITELLIHNRLELIKSIMINIPKRIPEEVIIHDILPLLGVRLKPSI